MTTLKLGWTNPLTDSFGAHPVLGPVLDLNDGVSFTLVSPDGLDLPAPRRTVVQGGNIRSQGERASRAIYRTNREAIAQLIVGPGASYSALVSSIRTLVSWLSAPPSSPITLQYQPFNASSPVYLDVVAAAHDIPADESDWLRLQFEPIEIAFIARPGMRGDRQTLQNLVCNPGFELPSGPGVTVFNDSFANANAYKLLAGSAPTVAGNVMTIQSGSTLLFGSTVWSAINLWQVRFNYFNGLSFFFYPHYKDGNNHLQVFYGGTTLFLTHVVGGTGHDLASGALTLANSTYYWLQVTQHQTCPGDAPAVTVTICADNAGAPGSALLTLGPIATYDAFTALNGQMGFQCSGGNLLVGGNFANVHIVALFGPGGWPVIGNTGTGLVTGAWETGFGSPTIGAPATLPASTAGPGSAANGGPVQSFGALRFDLPPAGTVSASWVNYNGGTLTPPNAYPIPVASAGDVFGVAFWVKTSGLSGTAITRIVVNEYDVNGTFLRQSTVGSQTGNIASWTRQSGTVTTGANTAYLALSLQVADATAGASASGMVWFDNVQCWDQTTTGLSAMPYCELRQPQSPAPLLVSGILGDLPAPSYLALGTYLSNWPLGGTLQYAVGRRARADAAAQGQMVGLCCGWFSTNASPTSTPILDAASWGGEFARTTVTAGWNPRPVSPRSSDEPGGYHMLCRFLSQQAVGNLGNVEVRAVTQQRSQCWYGQLNLSDQLGTYYGPYSYPLTQSNVWTLVDAGQVALPPFNAGALTDPTQTYLTPHPQWADLTSGGSVCEVTWGALLPVDGSLVYGILNNPSNAYGAIAAQYVWAYLDGLLVNRAGVGDGPAWTYSVESAPAPNPAHAGGGPGTGNTGVINVNSGADPYLTVDPTLELSGQGGVNQMVGYIADQNAAVLPFFGEIRYSPLYLYPR